MARQGYKRTGGSDGTDEVSARLREAMGVGSPSGGWEINGELLAVLVATTTAKGAAVQIGTNREGTALTFKVFSQGIPTTGTYSSVGEAEKAIAATACVFLPNDPKNDTLREWLEGFWKRA